MEALIVALVAGGLISAGVHLLREGGRRRARDEEGVSAAGGATSADLGEVRRGDVIVIEGDADLVVSGVVAMSDGPRRWREAKLADGRAERWLVVDAGDAEGEGDVVVGTRVLDPPPLGDEPPDALDLDGTIYTLDRWGHAEGDHAEPRRTGLPARGRGRYWNYARAGSERAWIRCSADRWWFFRGRSLPRHMVERLPGDG